MSKYIKLFSNLLDALDDLNDEQAGQLFKAIKQYEESGECSLTGIMRAVFVPFKQAIDSAKITYDETVERNKANGLKGGRPKTQNNPVGFLDNQEEPKKSQEKEKEKEKEKYNTGVFTPEQFLKLNSYRSMLKKPFKTQQAVTMMSNNFDSLYSIGYTFDELFNLMAEKQWQTVEVEWVKKLRPKVNSSQSVQKPIVTHSEEAYSSTSGYRI